MQVILTPQAQRDLEAISEYIAKDNARRAFSFVRELIGKCDELADFPERFPLVDRYRKTGIRHRVYGQYLIFYRGEASVVRVIHILQGATNYSALLDYE